ncbi:FtsK/SpoIIIE domain-containing protein [Nocardioides sp.]|uniref:FtsK/SpoIIIE domain-containing protein n=1 Tax=Nocardioides sp. TaxID=35761 RepID=UPI002CD20645|nr:FtsK/SpoIIIE domain-containing protein [Nocardioides sp.]HXH79860.1 FtsK/SpoIIIE domain-containing protein [Nocardioides sp.]
MPTWTLSVRSAPESGLPSVDVEVHARPEATVADLARALGQHLAPDQRRLDVVPLDGTHPWPAKRPLSECGLRTGDLIDVISAPHAWRDRPAQTTKPRAVLHVTEGPDRGQRLNVRGSSVSLGRGAHCTMRFTDSLVSQQHARIELGARPTVYDEGSANGTTVGDLRVTSPREVDWGTAIRLGRSTVVIEPGEVASTDPVVSVFRPPRFGNPLAEETLDVPSPPEKRRPSPLPWAMFALPVVMGLAMFMRSQTPYALVYMLAWPLVGYFGWRQQRKQAEKEFLEELQEWREDVDALITTIDDQAVLQRQRFHDDYADAETLRSRAAGRDRYLWARREDRDAFLVTRLGIGTVPALLRGEVKDGGDRQARREVAAELAGRDRLEDMPVLADLAQHSLVAITGEPDDVDALVRAMLLRLAFDHSPTDLSVAGCLGRVRSGHEAWLRWLPHAAAREGGEPPVAVGVQAGSALLDHILGEDGQRAHTICLVDEEAGLSRRTVEAIAASATDRQLHLVWLGRSAAEVPAATTLLIDLSTSPGGTVNLSDRRGVATIDLADRVTLEHAWRTARLMTAYVDEAAVLPASTAIPAHVRLSDVSPDFSDLDDADAVIRRWSQSTGLRAQIGAGVDGVVTLDLREDGPHGLVAGTTGSGKSELLQSLICSLALNNPPSRINFLLVDYKGGAAFRECGDLPHTVGYITDLTPALVSRALTSLSAEIAAREHLLGEYGVKDLVQLERERPDAAPPSLLICVDEFAALTAEVPEFVDGMVNIAQRGRSLGMHVMLATQRPAGVVTGNIRANADLRIALRVSSRDDSQDVIEAPDAAHISRRTPGRAWIRRTGHGTAELVQSAWTGARQPLAGSEVAVEVSAFTAAGREPDLDQVAARLNPRTDLERCVTTITTAFQRSGLSAPAQPWLPPLPAELLLDETDLAEQAAEHTSGHVIIGRIDEPAAQRQPALAIDFASVGHLLVYGASGSGKTELLRTALIAASVSDASCPGSVAPYVYGLDFAGGGLTAIAGLPTVEAIVPESHTGRVLRLIRLLRRTMRERTQTLASRGCSDLADLSRTGISLPRVYVAIDNLPALVESLESAGGVAREHIEHLQSVLQNGRRVGVHVIATVPGRGGVPSSLSASFGQRIVMRMTTADDYLMLGVPGNVLDSDTPAGAGLFGKRSIQVATTGGAGTPAQAERVAAIGELLGPVVGDRVRAPVPAMPTRLDQALLPAPVGTRIALGVDADAVSIVEADLLAGPILIAGRGRSGRTSALDAVELLLSRADEAVHVIREAGAVATMERLEEWLRTEAEGSGSCSLVMVDDAQVWDTEAGVDADSRTARDNLLRVVAEHPTRIALLATADTTQARVRGSVGALVDAVRQGRRGFLLQPEWNDGEVLGVTVPTKTTEPLTGPGRGVWCDGGNAVVAQLVTTDGRHQQTQDDRGVR